MNTCKNTNTFNHDNCIHVYMSESIASNNIDAPEENTLCIDNNNRTVHYQHSSSFVWYGLGENVKPAVKSYTLMSDIDKDICRQMMLKLRDDNSNGFPNNNLCVMYNGKPFPLTNKIVLPCFF